VLVRVGIYSDKDVQEALSILREYADGEDDQPDREAMHKVLDAVEALYKSSREGEL
jgi:predicted dehydrogenase